MLYELVDMQHDMLIMHMLWHRCDRGYISCYDACMIMECVRYLVFVWSGLLVSRWAIRRPFLTRRGHFPSLFYTLHYKAFTWWYMGASVVNYYVMIFVCTRGQLLSCFCALSSEVLGGCDIHGMICMRLYDVCVMWYLFFWAPLVFCVRVRVRR